MADAAEDAGASEAAPATVAAPAPSETLHSPVEAAPAVVEDPPQVAAVRRVFAEWRRRHMHNSPVSRATEVFGYLNMTAIPDLESMIIKEIS